MKVKVVTGMITKMKNRRVGLAYLSDGSWFIKGKSLCQNLGTGHKYVDVKNIRLTSEAMRALMNMFYHIVIQEDIRYPKEEK
jgi:hypothetical protein